jgi:branched chain amino acid efflux pump
VTAWVLIAVLAVGTIAFKVCGPLLAGGRRPSAALVRVIGLLAPALIAALVVSDTFTRGHDIVLDARAAGLAVGAVALWFKVPVLVALVLAAVTCAVLRAVT